jgi:hypothetical protein
MSRARGRAGSADVLLMTTAELVAELQRQDGSLPARVTAMTPDGTPASYDVTGVDTGPADYGQQVNISVS